VTERPASDRTRVRREPQRGVYDRGTIDVILDEGIVCHLGFVSEGQPCTAGEPEPDPALQAGFEPPVWSPTARVRPAPGRNGQIAAQPRTR
jgi:hypothetical protein